LFLVLPAII